MNLTFYYGTDHFRIKEAMEKKIASFLLKNKDGLVEKLDLEEEGSLGRAENILKTRSFFNEPKLVVMGHIFQDSRLSFFRSQDSIFELIDSNLQLIFYEYASSKDLQKKDEKFFNFLENQAKETKEFGNLREANLEKWALEKVIEAGFSIKLPVLKKLVFLGSFAGGQEQLSQEIEKLIAYQSYHGKKEIEEKAVTNLIKQETDINNFALIDAIGSRDIKKAVMFLNQTLSEGAEPHAVFGQIIYQFRNLLRIKSLLKDAVSPADIPKLTGMHPFVAQKTSRQARQFELDELKRIYRRLGEMDLKSKRGQIDLPIALFEFLSVI